jgi:hypothetical protein
MVVNLPHSPFGLVCPLLVNVASRGQIQAQEQFFYQTKPSISRQGKHIINDVV